MNEQLLAQPQWTTSFRLLASGEKITFDFYLPDGAAARDLTIFPRYLERANPGAAFVAGGSLDWLDRLECEYLTLNFTGGRATLSYQPPEPGNYIARWQAGGEHFYRYFSVIESDWIVLRFSAYRGCRVEPTLHAMGIPLDYRLPVERFSAEDADFSRLLEEHRHYGDTIAPVLPDTPATGSEAKLSAEDRVGLYGQMLAKARALLPDENDARGAHRNGARTRSRLHRGAGAAGSEQPLRAARSERRSLVGDAGVPLFRLARRLPQNEPGARRRGRGQPVGLLCRVPLSGTGRVALPGFGRGLRHGLALLRRVHAGGPQPR